MRMRRSSWLATAIVLVAHCAVARSQVDADTLKAAFIYNFAVYTTWPTPARDPATLTLCVDGTSALSPALRMLAGKVVQHRSLAVRETVPSEDAGECDILIVAPATPVPAPPARGLLTVCDCGDARGVSAAMIALVREGDRLRFDVDRRRASAAGLSLSSKLLRLARIAP
jgi:hypothetical protein